MLDDAALTGLDLMGSADRLATWLSEVTGVPSTVRLRRSRYKPGTSFVLAFDLTTEEEAGSRTQPCLALAYAGDARVKAAKTHEGVPPDHLLAYDAARAVVVTTARGDRSVPLLARLARSDARGALARILPERTFSEPPPIRHLRHNPERRWLGVLDESGAEPVLLRAYGSGHRAHRSARCYIALEAASARTPRLLGKSNSLAAVAVTWVDGDELTWSPRPEAWQAAGAELARLHSSEVTGLHVDSPREETAALHHAERHLADLLPHRANDVRLLTRVASRLLEQLPHDQATVHGDFSADQVVVRADATPALVDLDSAHRGPAAADLGCLVATSHSEAESGGMADRGRWEVDHLLGGYETVRSVPDPFVVGVQSLAFRIRKAVDPFRACHSDWREQVESRLDRALRVLDDLSSSGSGQ